MITLQAFLSFYFNVITNDDYDAAATSKKKYLWNNSIRKQSERPLKHLQLCSSNM